MYRHREGQRADLHEIPILQDVNLRQRLAIDQRSIATSQVLNGHLIRVERELGVFSAHQFAVGSKVACFAAADFEDRADKGDHFTLGLALHNDQLNLHGNRPDLIGSSSMG